MRKLNKKIINSRIQRKTFNQYKLMPMGKYENAHQKLPILHKVCGYVHYYTWSDFNRGRRCPYCSHHMKLNKSYIAKFIYKKTRGNYVLKLHGKYHNSTQKLPILHKDCGHIYYASWNKFHEGERCPYCFGKRKFTKQYIKNKIFMLTKGHYILKLIGPYRNAHQKLPILHKDCGHMYYACWGDFQQGKRCPYCRASNGEKYIEKLLQKFKIPFIHGYLTTCYMSKSAQLKGDPLHLDFYSPKYKIGIEFDGIQHQYWTKYFGTYENFLYQKVKDITKDKWCIKHHIILIRIKCYKNWFGKLDKVKTTRFLSSSLIPLIHILNNKY